MNYTPVSKMKVGLLFDTEVRSVGRLLLREKKLYFEYDADFVAGGLELSPLNCPLTAGVQTFDRTLYGGLPGLLYDSLPDAWGHLLLNRQMRAREIMPEALSPLDRLAHVGYGGMGALVYELDAREQPRLEESSLDWFADRTQEVLADEATEALDTLIAVQGSSAGARPKAMIEVNKARTHICYGRERLPQGFEPWMVKFPNTGDGSDAGAVEYVYAQMAEKAGLEVAPVHLFPARKGPGYFATRRFDRKGTQRLHMHSVCGLLHADFRLPSLDYVQLLGLTLRLTRDVREVEKMFRLAVFNVLAHNRDDHAKNFSFLMDAGGEWRLAPAYDLTFSSGPGGEQSTTLMGEGKNPSEQHLTALGREANLSPATIERTIEQTKAALTCWPKLAAKHGVSARMTRQVRQKLKP